MSHNIHPPKSVPTKSSFDEDQDLLETLQNIPSNFDLALNGSSRRYLSPNPNPSKEANAALVNAEGFRRPSISTISSFGLHSRDVSPYPYVSQGPTTWKTKYEVFWQRNKGLFMVAVAQMFGALMNVTTRLLELEGAGMHPFHVLFARMTITVFFSCLYMWWKNIPGFPFGAKEVRWLLVARGLSGFLGIFGMYYSLQYLPVADAIVITFLAPSVASYGCYLFLKEPFPRSAQYASLVSLLGVVLIARPTSLITSPSPEVHSSNSTSTSTELGADFPTPTSAQRLSAVAVAMIGVLGSAGAFTAIRWIGKRAHPLISVNYFATWCTLVSTTALTLSRPLHISDLHFVLPASLRQWSMLIFLGICGFITQYLLTTGLAAGGKSNGARATNMIYTQMLGALALDKLVFGQSPSWWSLAGSGLILGSAVFVAVNKQEVPFIEGDEELALVEEEGIPMMSDTDGIGRGRSTDMSR